jgi:hypothetical protein
MLFLADWVIFWRHVTVLKSMNNYNLRVRYFSLRDLYLKCDSFYLWWWDSGILHLWRVRLSNMECIFILFCYLFFYYFPFVLCLLSNVLIKCLPLLNLRNIILTIFFFQMLVLKWSIIILCDGDTFSNIIGLTEWWNIIYESTFEEKKL